MVAEGCEVAVLHRGELEPEDLPHVQHLHGDRTSLLDYRPAFERFAPDVVLDMVPMTRSDAVDTVIAFDGLVGRIVGISSQDVYLAYDILRGREPGPPVDQPMIEEAPLRERLYPYRELFAKGSRLYAYDKIPVEQTYLADAELPGTILRLPAVYGPGDYQHRPFPYLKRMVDGRRSIILDERAVDWRWSRSYVENTAAAIVLAVTESRAAGRVYNVADSEIMSESEWIRAIGDANGWAGEIVPLPTDQVPEHLRDEMDFAQSLAVDTSRIRRELGYREPVAWEEALSRTIEWELAAMPEELPPHRFDYDAEDAALPDLTLGI